MWQSWDAVFNLCHWGRSLVSLRFPSICNRIQLQSEKSKIISKFFFSSKKNQSELEGRQDNQTLLHQKELINAKDSQVQFTVSELILKVRQRYFSSQWSKYNYHVIKPRGDRVRFASHLQNCVVSSVVFWKSASPY